VPKVLCQVLDNVDTQILDSHNAEITISVVDYSTVTNIMHRVKPCPHCRRKVRLWQKTATVATVSLFCDSVDRA